MTLLHALRDALVPPLCLACGRLAHHQGDGLCPACERRLASAEPLRGVGPPGVDRAWSSAPHEGVARELVVALKHRRLTPAAVEMAARIDRLIPPALRGGVVVPVPTAPLRTSARGFDPAALVAAAYARRADAICLHGVLKRLDGGRQVGRRRGERLGRPPRIGLSGPPPRSVVLVDDVMTTGATISACARALRAAGAVRVVAVTFSRRL